MASIMTRCEDTLYVLLGKDNAGGVFVVKSWSHMPSQGEVKKAWEERPNSWQRAEMILAQNLYQYFKAPKKKGSYDDQLRERESIRHSGLDDSSRVQRSRSDGSRDSSSDKGEVPMGVPSVSVPGPLRQIFELRGLSARKGDNSS